MEDFDSRLQFREWDEYDLSEDATIDKNALDVEAERQSHLVMKWSLLLTQAQATLSEAKEGLAHIEAVLFLRARTELPNKPTEATIKSWILTQPEFRKAQRTKRKAENNVTYLQNAKAVLENKRSMIKVEAELWVCGYYSRPMIREQQVGKESEQYKEEVKEQLQSSYSKRHLRQKD